MFTKRVHVFKAGPQTSAQGVEREFTPQDLQQVVETYDPSTHEAPLVIGHSGDNDSTPSYGWIKKFVREGDNLYADVNFTDVAKDLVKDGHYRKVSISFYSPNSPINPHQGKWSARHLALLGAAPPAVKGLEPLSFAETQGVFDFAVSLAPEEIFDKDLGPTMILDRSPLEILKERLEELKGDMNSALEDLKQNQDEQSESETPDSETTNQADANTAPENPNQTFSEMKMKKKMGREGAEVSESAQKLANLETQAPEGDEEFDEGTTRVKAKGAHGQQVQVVQEVFEEHGLQKMKAKQKAMAMEDDEDMEEDDEDEYGELPPALKKNMEKMKAKHAAKKAAMAEEEDEEEDYGELPPALKKNMEKMKAKHAHKAEMEDDGDEDDDEYSEVGYKTTAGGKVSFGKRAQKDSSDPAGRGTTARSSDDSYGDRQSVGKAKAEDREGLTSNKKQDEDRVRTAKNAQQEQNRTKLSKASEADADGESRWADQPSGKKRAMNADQFDDDAEDLDERQRPGTSEGTEPHGRDGGPTKVSALSEEAPDDEEIVVPLESTRNNKTARVLHTSSGQKRAPLKGGEIADHSEESDGVTRTARTAAVSDGSDARGRDGGSTKFPSRSEEDPDDLEMAVDLEDATKSNKVRIIRQKSGDKASVDHAEEIEDLIDEILAEFAEDDEEGMDVEECEGSSKKMSRKYSEVRDPMTRTGKGSTYGQKASEMEDEDEDEEFNEFLEQILSEYSDEDEDEEDYSETEDFCGMGSMGQPRAMGFPQQMYEELMNLKAENDRLKKEYEEQKIRSRKEKIASFVDSLYTEGKLTDGIMPQREFQQYCEGLELGTLEFSEGESPTSKLFEMLSRLPNMVYFGEVVAEGIYQTPDQEEEDLDPHTRAMRMVANGEAADYVEAIKRCITWGGR